MNNEFLSSHPIVKVAMKALEQVEQGKGKERHGQDGAPFENQPIFQITEMTGPRGPFYQVIKKAHEAVSGYENGTLNPEKVYDELIGAVVYMIALAYYFGRDLEQIEFARHAGREFEWKFKNGGWILEDAKTEEPKESDHLDVAETEAEERVPEEDRAGPEQDPNENLPSAGGHRKAQGGTRAKASRKKAG